MGKCGQERACTHLTANQEDCLVELGRVADWGALSDTVMDGFGTMGVDVNNPRPTSHGLVIGLPVMTNSDDILGFVQMAFDTLRVPRVLLVNPWIAMLMSTGHETGLVFYIAPDAVAIAPVSNMVVVRDATSRIPLGSVGFADKDFRNAMAEVSKTTILQPYLPCTEHICLRIQVRSVHVGRSTF